MSIKRRKFIKMLPIGALLPTQMLSGLSSQIDLGPASLLSNNKLKNIDQLFKMQLLLMG